MTDLSSYDDGWRHGYRTALDEADIAINQQLNASSTLFADHAGLRKALHVLQQLRKTGAKP